MNEQVIVIGAGGHGKVIADIVRCCGNTVLGFLDDSSQLPISVCGIPVLGKIESYVNYPDASFVIAIGNGTVRQRVAERLAGVKWYTDNSYYQCEGVCFRAGGKTFFYRAVRV